MSIPEHSAANPSTKIFSCLAELFASGGLCVAQKEQNYKLNGHCLELKFMKTLEDETLGAFKVPTLRNVSATAPYMHSGQFSTLGDVLKHYQKRPIGRVGHTDLLVVKLSDTELEQLEAFLHTLGN